MSIDASVDAAMAAALREEFGAACALRWAVHAEPDLSGQEEATRDRVLAALPPGGEVTLVAETGAVVRYGGPGPSIALRAELDALPITEATGLEHSSRRVDAMHACGHDVHLAALTGVVRAAHAVGLPVPVTAVLQPREETLRSGALDIIESGVLARAGVSSVVAAHLQPSLPPGVVSCTPGAVNASADEFVLTLRGSGGHAAYPHLVDDTIVAMSHVIVALQSVVSRRIDPISQVVLSIGSITGGRGPNVLPGEVVARGTLRAMSVAAQDDLHRLLREVAETTARAHGCRAEVAILPGEPVLVNDSELTGRTAAQLVASGLDVVSDLRTMGADDFAFFGDHLPALMMFVGVDGHGGGLHSPLFAAGDEAVRNTMLAYASAYTAAVPAAGVTVVPAGSVVRSA